MRNFEERIAEIERRSEKIIKQRKQRRKHILMACVPLVLTVGIYTGLIAPNMHRKTAEDIPPGAAEGFTADMIESMTDSVVEIQVEGVNVCHTYSASTEIQTITGQFEEFSTRAPASGAFSDEAYENTKEDTPREEDRSYPMEDAASLGYAITLILEDGSKVEYYLQGNVLENRTEEKFYILTQGQLEELKTLIGIVQP